MIRWLLIGVLALGIVGTGVWGYQEHKEKNAILVQAENSYQRAFHDLTYQMELLHDKMGTVLAMNTQKQLSPQLADIWRLTSEAHNDVGQLPLVLLPFNKTEEFLANIGEFSYRTAIRDLSKKPLSDDEVSMLNKLYKQSGEIKNELRKVQHTVLNENLKWMDVELALATEDKSDNKIIDGFKTVEKNVEGYSEGDLGPMFTGATNDNHEFRFVKGEDLSEEEAKEKTKNIFSIPEGANITMTKSGKGAEIPTYSISYRGDRKNGYMDMTIKGGNPIDIMVDRKVKEQELSLYKGLNKAEEFLKRHEYKGMEAFQSSQYDNIGVYSFLYVQDEVRVYPDSMQVKVALDNGDVLGLSARDFLRNHEQRSFPKPALSEEKAKENVNPNVKIQEHHLALIENDLNEEVLCYEFVGTMGESTYRIFINAKDGTEEKVEKLKQSEMKFGQTA
ncbi:germination protein YpeB [Pontibacillus yanchengensis]|uniref:Germination protein YpeB n=2 Tax=Pontibacillus yanchengensis TaxID=462910 RepID=A0ACC7VJH5_9BACI|nr:germination protein YpeB [Pontibacillus yanchengensis]MYL32724.1 germination protein YpeB [Pontibacillus yanchengensis]MYL55118.1 germination protein YpeB [Pontibacillus yanchengensis]